MFRLAALLFVPHTPGIMHGVFVLDLHDLDAAGKTYSAPISLSFLRSALEGSTLGTTDQEGHLEVRYSRAGQNIVVKGSARVPLQIPCSRCLEPTLFEANGDIALLLVPAHSPRATFAKGVAAAPGANPNEYEFRPEEAELDTYQGNEIALDPFVREALLLEVPLFPLCSDNCAGIARHSEQEQGASAIADLTSVDPRLLPLLKLIKKEKN